MSANVVRAMRTRCRTRARTSARMRMENREYGRGLGMKIKMKMKIQNEICTFSRMVACPPEQICQLAKQNEYTHMLTHSLTHTCIHSHTLRHACAHTLTHCQRSQKSYKICISSKAFVEGDAGGRREHGECCQGVRSSIWEFLVAFGGSIKRVSQSLAPFLLIITR